MTWAERTTRLWEQCRADEQLRKQVETNRDLANWCSRNTWHVFWTQTYRGNHSEDAARSRILYFLAECIWSSTIKDVLWVVEPHKHIPSHHVHLLLSLKPRSSSASYKTPLQIWARDWRKLKNECWDKMGKALILPITAGCGAVWYVLKYVTKRVHDAQSRELARAVATPQKLWGIETSLTPQERPRLLAEIQLDAQEVADYDSVVQYFESKGTRRWEARQGMTRSGNRSRRN